MAAWWALLLAMVLVVPAAAQSKGTYHKVRSGESLESISRRYRVPVYDIAKANRLSTNARPTPGTNLWVPAVASTRIVVPARSSSSSAPARTAPRPAVSVPSSPQSSSTPGMITVKPGDSLWGLAKRYGTTVDALAAANGISSRAGLEVGQRLRLPGAGMGGSSSSSGSSAPVSRPPVSTSSGSQSTGSSGSAGSGAMSVGGRGYSWPVKGKVLRGFEKSTTTKHFGIDIAVPVGTEVRAARDGKVVYSGETITAYGKMVIVEHEGGMASCYAFNSRNLVSVNQSVRRGDKIALSGDGGNSTQPLLHFQIRRNGDAIDPLPYLP